MLLLELIGVAAFAVSGAMVGIERKADIFGVVFLALVTALGGGIIRDILLGHLPPRMFTSYVYVALAVVCAVLVFVDARHWHDQYMANVAKLDAVVNVFDAAGLAAFTVTGVELTIAECGMHQPLLAVALGMCTGIGGGMLRDTLTNTMPAVLRKRVYAVASLAGALVYYALLRLGAGGVPAALVSMALIFALRMCATIFKWNLPKA